MIGANLMALAQKTVFYFGHNGRKRCFGRSAQTRRPRPAAPRATSANGTGSHAWTVARAVITPSSPGACLCATAL